MRKRKLDGITADETGAAWSNAYHRQGRAYMNCIVRSPVAKDGHFILDIVGQAALGLTPIVRVLQQVFQHPRKASPIWLNPEDQFTSIPVERM